MSDTNEEKNKEDFLYELDRQDKKEQEKRDEEEEEEGEEEEEEEEAGGGGIRVLYVFLGISTFKDASRRY